MTDNEIIQALVCCGKTHNERNDEYCKECHFKNYSPCVAFLCDRVIAHINLQKAYIETLKERIIVQKYKEIPLGNEVVYRIGWENAFVEAIKTEAYKEFAEKLKEKSDVTQVDAFHYAYVISDKDIDNLLAEMESESNA